MADEQPAPVHDRRPCLMDGIDTLTLPYGAPSDAVVAAVGELTLPYREPPPLRAHPVLPVERWQWTLGHLLLLLGGVVVVVLGGVWADAQVQMTAARGDSAGVVLSPRPSRPGDASARPIPPTGTPVPPPGSPQPRFQIPVLNRGSAAPAASAEATRAGRSTITRLVIPAIQVDRAVVEVGWSTEEIAGQAVTVWEVDRYRVGHHQGSSQPGGGGNIVLSGHSGGSAYPFNELFYVQPGDRIDLWSYEQVYAYAVSDHIVVDEVGQPLEQRLENARFIATTDDEVLTLIACWPLTGPQKFTQRVIIRAKPVATQQSKEQLSQEQSSWTIR